MPITQKGLSELKQKGLIPTADYVEETNNLKQQQKDIKPIYDRYIEAVVNTVKENWPAMILDAKGVLKVAAKEATKPKTPTQKTFEAMVGGSLEYKIEMAKLGWHAFGLASGWILNNPGTAIGDSGEEVLLKHGVNPKVAAFVGDCLDFYTSMKAATYAGQALRMAGESVGLITPEVKQAIAAKVPDAAVPKAQKVIDDQIAILTKENAAMKETLGAGEKAAGATPRQQEFAATGGFVEKAAPAAAVKAPLPIPNAPPPGSDVVSQKEMANLTAEEWRAKIMPSLKAQSEAQAKSLSDAHDAIVAAQEKINPTVINEGNQALSDAAKAVHNVNPPPPPPEGFIMSGKTGTVKPVGAASSEIGGISASEFTDDVLKEQERWAQHYDPTTHTNLSYQEYLKNVKVIRGGAPGPEDSMGQFRQVVKDYQANLDKYKGQPLTREKAQAQAAKLLSKGYDINDVMAILPGQAKNPAETLAVVETLMPYAKETMDLRQAARTDDAAYKKIIDNLTTSFGANPAYFGIRSVGGQTLGIYREPTLGRTKFLGQWHDTASWVAGENLKTNADVWNVRDRLLNVLDNFDAPEQVMQSMLSKPEVLKPGWLDLLASYRVQNLLGPIVLTKKLSTDVAVPLYNNLVEKPFERAVAGVIGPKGVVSNYAKAAGISMLDNPLGIMQKDVPVSGEVLQSLFAWRSGWAKAYHYIRGGNFEELAGLTNQAGRAPRVNVLTQALEDKFGTAGATIGNALGFIPNSIKVLTNGARLAAFESETTGRLWREGVGSGLTGDALANYVEMGKRNLPSYISKAGLDYADMVTMTGDPGAFGNWVADGLRKFHVMKFEMPFWRMPYNLLRYPFQRSPILSLLSPQNYKDIAAGGINAVDAFGKIAIGNIVGGGLVMAGRSGMITGYGPTDARLRQELIDAGLFHPFSIYNPISDNWVSYEMMHPVKPFLGIAADIGYLWGQLPNADSEGTIKNMEHALWAFGVATTNNFADNPFFTGAEDVARTLSDLKSGRIGGTTIAEKSAARFVSGFIPWSQTVKYATQMIDPALKEVHGFAEQVASGIYPLNQDLYPHRDPLWGKPVNLPDSFGPRIISNIRTAPNINDPLGQEHQRLQITFGDNGDHILGPIDFANPTAIVTRTGVGLNPEEQDFINQRKGEIYRANAESYFNGSGYTDTPDAKKIREFHTIRGSAREQAVGEARDKFPSLAERIDQHMATGGGIITPQVDQGRQDYQAMRESGNAPQNQTEEFFPLTLESPEQGAPP